MRDGGEVLKDFDCYSCWYQNECDDNDEICSWYYPYGDAADEYDRLIDSQEYYEYREAYFEYLEDNEYFDCTE